jgi:hypothetical protein
MPSSATTVGQAYGEGAVGSGVARYYAATDPSQRLAAVQAWAEKRYPFMSSASRASLVETVRSAAIVGQRLSNRADNSAIPSNQITSTVRSQSPTASTRISVYYVEIVYRYTVRTENGGLRQGYFRETLQFDKPPTPGQINEMAQVNFNPIKARLMTGDTDPRKLGHEITFREAIPLAIWRGL